jgi:predicted nucleotidyltransferase
VSDSLTADCAARLEQFFAADSRGTAAVYLFGSMARGSPREGSDVDVAVLFEHDPPRTLDGLSTNLAEALECCVGRPVDLVVLNRAPVDLVHRVLADGLLVSQHSPSARIRFEVHVRNEYFDLEPVLRQYRRVG